MTIAVIPTTKTQVRVDNQQNVMVVTIGIQGPPGPQGADGAAQGSIRHVSSDYTIQLDDEMIYVDTTAGDVNITVPLASAAYNSTTREGKIFNIVKSISSLHLVNVFLSGSDKIWGVSSYQIEGLASTSIQADGVNNIYSFI